MVIPLGPPRERVSCPSDSITYTPGETGRLFKFAQLCGGIQLTNGTFEAVSTINLLDCHFARRPKNLRHGKIILMTLTTLENANR